jgi:hypothetical protein
MTIRRRLESLGRRADGALADSALLSTRAFGATLEVDYDQSTTDDNCEITTQNYRFLNDVSCWGFGNVKMGMDNVSNSLSRCSYSPFVAIHFEAGRYR